jgi:hypothetical protein
VCGVTAQNLNFEFKLCNNCEASAKLEKTVKTVKTVTLKTVKTVILAPTLALRAQHLNFFSQNLNFRPLLRTVKNSEN